MRINYDNKKLPFEKCIQKVIYTNKIKSENYLSQGKYPIVSQEDSLINGYWNIKKDVFYVSDPVIIFGDHTRVIKYIDFSFVLGADGVKILKPVTGIDAKFFYYYLYWYKIPSLGYSRHYKLLKEIEVPIPSPSIQNQIVKELDTLQSIITKKKAQLVELDNLAQTTFYEMFGDPVRNQKNWDKKLLSNICKKITDGTHHSPQNSIEGDYPYITAKNIKKDGIDLSNLTYISQIDHEQIFSRCNPEKGDILYIKDGATTGIAQINTFDFQFSLLSSVALLKPNIKYITSYYLRDYLNNETIYQNIRDNMGGAAITRLTIKKIQSIKVLCPPLDLQNQFAKRIEAIEKQKALINQSISETQLLFDSAMDNYFN